MSASYPPDAKPGDKMLKPEPRQVLREAPGYAEICGSNPLFPPERLGCGKPIKTCREVYRCTECTTPFHRDCAIEHFKTET